MQGDLFFGSVESLSHDVLEDAGNASFVVLDCRRIGVVDTAAATLLARLCAVMAESGAMVYVTRLADGASRPNAIEESLVHSDVSPRPRFFEDADTALEEAETLLIATSAPTVDVTPFVEFDEEELLAGCRRPSWRSSPR